jgi:hypothetical protein
VIAEDHPLSLPYDPIGGGINELNASRRVMRDGIVVDHPRYVFPPKVLRNWYGSFFHRSIAMTFERAVREFKPDVVLGSWAYPAGWATH